MHSAEFPRTFAYSNCYIYAVEQIRTSSFIRFDTMCNSFLAYKTVFSQQRAYRKCGSVGSYQFGNFTILIFSLSLPTRQAPLQPTMTIRSFGLFREHTQKKLHRPSHHEGSRSIVTPWPCSRVHGLRTDSRISE